MRKIYLALLICFFTSVSVNAQDEAAKPAPVDTIGDPAKFSAGKPTVLITGANRGIGLEFVKQFSGRDWNIIATARKPEAATDLQEIAKKYDRLVVERLDVTDFERMQELKEKYTAQTIDVLLSNAGITPKYKSAFKKVAGVDWDMMRKSLDVNAIAPLQLAQTFIDNVAASEQKKIVIISSKAGSFELGPKLPMMYSYRGSKAALNMYMYTLSFETPKKDVILTLLSPGQVNTMPGMKIPNAIETDESVSKMLVVIDSLTPEQNGKFLDFEDGRELGW
jgi:NAD(P)-dependent dehydrogenase (short-subunit alcohol dehydrogenase family)